MEPDPDDTKDQDKVFTQADVGRMIADRLKRAKTEPPADYADLQAKAQKLAALEAAQLTDQERQQKAAEEAAKRAQEAEDRAKAAEERAAAALRRSAVVAAASRLGAVDPDAVFALLDPAAVTVGDDGQVTGVDEAVKSLLDTKQYLVGKPPTPTPGGADGGPRGKPAGTITREQLAAMTPEAIDKAHRAGELDHLIGKS